MTTIDTNTLWRAARYVDANARPLTRDELREALLVARRELGDILLEGGDGGEDRQAARQLWSLLSEIAYTFRPATSDEPAPHLALTPAAPPRTEVRR